ncbi:hypothetical protein D3C84_632100 [compost metagenome]
MTIFGDLLEELRKTHLGVNIHSIHNIPSDQMLSPVEERLAELGIPYDEVIYFTPTEDEEHNTVYGQHICAAGATSFFLKDGTANSTIFMNGNIGKLTNTEDSELENILKYIFLIHEIGHAEDFNKQINFHHTTRKVDLVSAEAYADIFTLKHLKSSKNPAMKLARKYYCKNILANTASNEFYKAVFTKVKKSFLESKVREWARA